MKIKKPFEGLKVFDLTTAGVGPYAGRCLAWWGATVVRAESAANYDTQRTMGPYRNHFSHPDYTSNPDIFNSGKLHIGLNLKTPEGLKVAWKLVEWCDVFSQANPPGVMEKFGLDYENIRKVKPEIVYFHSTTQGNDGPHKAWKAFGASISAVAGHYHYMGYPDREPSTHYIAYNDYVAGHYSQLAIASAVAYWKRTGKGQEVVLSQVQSGLQFVAPGLMDYAANGRVSTRNGNKVTNAAPHDAYACKGQQRWVAIAVTNDAEWEAFKQVIGAPAWASDPKFATLLGRKENEDELNKLVNGWTAEQEAEEVMVKMQAAGVPAGVVENEKEWLADENLRARGHWVELKEHPYIGDFTIHGPQAHFSKTPGDAGRWVGPIGQDNEYVYKELLGMTDDEIADCMVAGAFE